jgi:tetratricopeptide (TPR) repeat protein
MMTVRIGWKALPGRPRGLGRARGVWCLGVLLALAGGASAGDGWPVEHGRGVDALATGDAAGAERHLRRALETATEAGDDAAVAVVLVDLGRTCADLGRFEEAVELLHRAIEIRRDRRDARALAVAMTELGIVYLGWERPGDAEGPLSSAKEIGQSVIPPDHSDWGRLLGGHGELRRRLGRTDQAEPLLVEALAITGAVAAPDDHDLAALHESLGLVLMREGRLDEAAPHARRAVALLEAAAGPDHRWLVVPLEHLATLLDLAGRRAESDVTLRRAASIAARTGAPRRVREVAWEGEGLRVTSVHQARGVVQSMAPWGEGWSDDAQLSINALETGSVNIELPVEVTGRYRAVIHVTKGPEYGRFRLLLDRKLLGPLVDGYADLVRPAGPIPLGEVVLVPGIHELTVQLDGRDERSTGHLVGLDRLRLVPVTPPPAETETPGPTEPGPAADDR